MNKTQFTIETTIKGETRAVEVTTFATWDNRRAESNAFVGAFQKRPGQKVWPARLTFWMQPDGSWKLATQATILNRANYRLIDWADNAESNRSMHNSAY